MKMNSKNKVLSWYEKIAELTDCMLVLTRTRRWGDLPALETQYSDMIEQLKAIEPLHVLNAEQSAQKCRLLYVINSNQYKISSFIQPQLDALGDGLRNLELQRRLH
ncbi:MAG: flagellar protein FliT [Polaromonas sp.]|jgi:flagellar protein FliT|nr:flagellar protein FliT [Polaromonas sp.]